MKEFPDQSRRRHSTRARTLTLCRASTQADYFRLEQREATREQGIPRVDTHVYSRENGWAIQALATAVRRHRRTQKRCDDAGTGGDRLDYRPPRPCRAADSPDDEKDVAGPYLGDTLFMGNAFLDALCSAPRESDSGWNRARSAAQTISTQHFKSDSRLMTLHDQVSAERLVPTRQLDENVVASAVCQSLESLLGSTPTIGEMAEHAHDAISSLQGDRCNSRGFQVGRNSSLPTANLSSPPCISPIVGS